MQIKPRKPKPLKKCYVQLLRSKYDRDTKRSRQVCIGSFNTTKVPSMSDLPAKIATVLRDSEREQLIKWFEEMDAADSLQTIRDRINSAGQVISDIAKTLEGVEPTTMDQLKSILKATLRLTRSIRKRGVVKKDLIADNIDEIIAAVSDDVSDDDRKYLRVVCEKIAENTDPRRRPDQIKRANARLAEMHRSGQLSESVNLEDFLDSVGIDE